MSSLRMAANHNKACRFMSILQGAWKSLTVFQGILREDASFVVGHSRTSTATLSLLASPSSASNHLGEAFFCLPFSQPNLFSLQRDFAMVSVPVRLLSILQHASCEASHSLESGGQNSVRRSYVKASEKKALSVAMQNYLITKKGLPAVEAALIVKNAPTFVNKLMARAKEHGILQHKLPTTAGTGIDDEVLSKFQSKVDSFLESERVNEIEAYFETLGLADFSLLEETLASVQPKLLGENGLLATTEVLHSLGIPRKKLWRLYERDKKLLNLAAADLNASIQMLESLGVQKKAMPALVNACPLVFHMDLEQTMKKVLSYMEGVGIDKSFIGRLLQYNPQEVLRARETHFGEKIEVLLECGLSKEHVIRVLREFPQLLTLSLDHQVRPNIEFLQQLNLTPEQMSKVITGSPQILSYSVKKNMLPKIAYLESLGVLKENIGQILVKFTGIFGHSIEESMTPKVKFLESFGVERKNIGKILTQFPAILGYSIEENLAPKLKYLESIGMERGSLGRVITRSPSILGLSVEKNMKPKVAFFEKNGVKGRDLAKLFSMQPSVLGRAIDGSLSTKLKFLTSLGIEPRSIIMARALTACAAQSLNSLESKYQNLVTIGLSHEAVRKIVTQQPTVLHLSEEHLVEKINYLIQDVGFSMEEVAKCPPLLSYSLEQRIKPRHRVISWLKSNRLLEQKYPFSRVMSISEKIFEEKFVEPNPEAAALYKDLCIQRGI
ncbi:unnamed protein product [Sphagnum jensenii]|uniref:Mitochondrial transcription termination factor n=1 Tax=Sphagnum jensenii TaxID=128206 RepID=A0ABP0WF63_9BRYO